MGGKDLMKSVCAAVLFLVFTCAATGQTVRYAIKVEIGEKTVKITSVVESKFLYWGPKGGVAVSSTSKDFGIPKLESLSNIEFGCSEDIDPNTVEISYHQIGSTLRIEVNPRHRFLIFVLPKTK